MQINVAVSVLTAVVVGLMLSVALYRLNMANDATRCVDEIISGSFERIVFRNDYVYGSTARAKDQWYAWHDKIGGLLRSAPGLFRNERDEKVIKRLNEDHESIGKIFTAIVAVRERTGLNSGSAPLTREVEERLVNQMNMRVYDVVLNSRKLLEASREARDSALRLVGAGVVFALLALIATAMVNSWHFGRAITLRIDRLRDGVAKIGSGDLEHRIEIKGNDELAELSTAFNAMTAKLRGSYRDLESEIEVRKRAEEEVKRLLASVQEEKERLSCLVNGISDEVWFADPNGTFTLANPSAVREFSLGSPFGGDVSALAASLEVYRSDGSPRPVEEAPPLRALSGEVIRDEEEIIRTPGRGVLRHRQVSAAPVRNADGEIIGSVSVVRDITDRKLAEETLREAHGELARLLEERTRELAEKEVLLKEVHHRVKNNLQVISSLVGLQADGSRDETVRQVLRDVTDRVRSMALVHEKLYQSANLACIDFAEYSRGLLSYLWRAHGGSSVRLTLDLEPVSLPVDTAVPLGLILNELAGNALKHAFLGRPGGEVTVSLKGAAGGKISLGVSDNGVGLPEGLDWRRARSLGLRLVQMLAGQIGADVQLASGEGTRFEVVLSNPS
ncbi:MAG TPA: histidine kinase dimerization/phosphoacceptor domain -containing protein [Geobacteraceae bacterium]